MCGRVEGWATGTGVLAATHPHPRARTPTPTPTHAGGESAVERVYEDLIPADVFVAEVAELLEGAYVQQQQGLEQLKDLLRLLDQGGQGQSQGGGLSEQQWRAAEEEAVALRSVLLARDASLACVARVLELAVEARRRMFQ